MQAWLKASTLSLLGSSCLVSAAALDARAIIDPQQCVYLGDNGGPTNAHTWRIKRPLPPWGTNTDYDGFCNSLEELVQARDGCSGYSTWTCEEYIPGTVSYLRWQFDANVESCPKEAIHEIWTAAGGNESIGFLNCWVAPPPEEDA